MKINFDEVDYKEMYKVGNVIINSDNMLFLVAEGSEYGYVLVNLSKNMVTRAYETLEELADTYGEEDDTLVNAEIMCFRRKYDYKNIRCHCSNHFDRFCY